MTGGALFLLLLIVLLVVSLPQWPHNRERSWGYTPTGGVGILIIVLLFLIWFGKI